ncbi:hypothetical protein V3F56_11165 [Moorellaceae bacterium AZ2]
MFRGLLLGCRSGAAGSGSRAAIKARILSAGLKLTQYFLQGVAQFNRDGSDFGALTLYDRFAHHDQSPGPEEAQGRFGVFLFPVEAVALKAFSTYRISFEVKSRPASRCGWRGSGCQETVTFDMASGSFLGHPGGKMITYAQEKPGGASGCPG